MKVDEWRRRELNETPDQGQSDLPQQLTNYAEAVRSDGWSYRIAARSDRGAGRGKRVLNPGCLLLQTTSFPAVCVGYEPHVLCWDVDRITLSLRIGESLLAYMGTAVVLHSKCWPQFGPIFRVRNLPFEASRV